MSSRWECYLHWVIPWCILGDEYLLLMLSCCDILRFPKNFESWVLFDLTTQKMFWIRALFQVFLINYHDSVRWHVWIFVDPPLLGANLRVSWLVSRWFPCLGLIDHPWCSWRLEAPLLLIMNCWIARHLCLRSLEILWHNMLEAQHILIHVRLSHHIREILRRFRMISVYDSQIAHIFIGTTFKAFDSTLEGLASLLYSCFAIGLHERR